MKSYTFKRWWDFMESQFWSFSIEVHNLLHISGNLSRKFGFKGELKRCFSYRDGWASRAYYPNFIRYTKVLCDWFQGEFGYHLPLIEFAYNNYHFSIQMTPYEALYWRRWTSLFGWFKVGEAGLIAPNLVHQVMEKVKVIQEKLKMT